MTRLAAARLVARKYFPFDLATLFSPPNMFTSIFVAREFTTTLISDGFRSGDRVAAPT